MPHCSVKRRRNGTRVAMTDKMGIRTTKPTPTVEHVKALSRTIANKKTAVERRTRNDVSIYFNDSAELTQAGALGWFAKNLLIRPKTFAYIGNVTFPVDVFCWLG
jgi:hypothetical protein